MEDGPPAPDDPRVHLVAVPADELADPRARHRVALDAGLGVLDVRDLAEAELPAILGREVSRARAKEAVARLRAGTPPLPAVVLDARSDDRAALASLGGFGAALVGLVPLLVGVTWALVVGDTTGLAYAAAAVGLVAVLGGLGTAWGASRRHGDHRASIADTLARHTDAQARAAQAPDAWEALQHLRRASLDPALPERAAEDLWAALEAVEAAWRTSLPGADDLARLRALIAHQDAEQEADGDALSALQRAARAAATTRRELQRG
ncbi:MAG: hypothetical protein H6732_08620 [Alphaproteobacteria bacterium]|nr:hypothetical protein [Alphaproteobacteria bacterium]